MARHEELEEEYIDAYFALLMEEIGLEEGKRGSTGGIEPAMPADYQAVFCGSAAAWNFANH